MLAVGIEKHQGELSLNVEFALEKSGITAVFGPSGAGKTTLINCIAGLLSPDRGSIVCHGSVFFDAETGICLPPEKRHVGYVFQDGRLFPHLSVQANLLFGRRFGKPVLHESLPSLDDVLTLMGIAPLLSRRPSTLSGGEKQRVAIGRALLGGSRLLLMDEPLTALDIPRRLELMEYIARIPHAWDVSILYVTHSPEEVIRLASHILVLNHGRMTAFGPASLVLPHLPGNENPCPVNSFYPGENADDPVFPFSAI